MGQDTTRKCDICNGDIDESQLSPADEIITCEKHKVFARCSQLWLIKKKFNLPFVEPERKCEWCKSSLTEEEFASLNWHMRIITCSRHRKYSQEWNVNQAKVKIFYGTHNGGKKPEWDVNKRRKLNYLGVEIIQQLIPIDFSEPQQYFSEYHFETYVVEKSWQLVIDKIEQLYPQRLIES